jgi:hypothetical protein
MSGTDSTRNAGGFTVVELLVTSAMMIVVMLAVFGTTQVVAKAVNTHDRAYEVDDAVRGALHRLSQIVQPADSATVRVRTSPGGSWIVPVTGTAYPALRFTAADGATVAFEFVLDASEVANGTDDDGDGLVDEGSLTVATSATAAGRGTLLITGVEQCTFTMNGRLLQAVLRCTRRDQNRVLHSVTRAVKVYLRNG